MTTSQKGLIGAMLMDAAKVMPICVSKGLTSAWFDGHYATICSIVMDQWGSTGVSDILSVFREIERKKHGIGLDVLESAGDSTVVPHCEHYIDMVKSEYMLSAAAVLAERQTEILKETSPDDIVDVVAGFRSEWATVTVREVEETTIKEDAESLIAEWASPTSAENVVQWPTKKMQDNIGWLSDELVYIAARESVGKTSLVLQMAVENGYRGIHGAIASLESKQRKLVQRMIAMVGRVDVLRMRLGNGTDYEFDSARGAIDKIDRLPISIADYGMSIEQVRAFAEIQIGRGAQYLIVDNMKHIRPGRKYSSTVEQFRDMSSQLKWLRDDLGIPVIVLHHLNKDMDLSWSDDIRRDADVIMFLSEDEEARILPSQENNWVGRDNVIVDVIKNREGMKNTAIRLDFNKRFQTFSDLEAPKPEQGYADPM